MADERHNVAFMVGIIFGALGAGIATLLLTPLSGQRTREQLAAGGAGLLPTGGRVPDHLDSGTYARLGEDDGARETAGPGLLATLKERVQGMTGEGGPVATLREKAQALTGDGGDRHETVAPGEAVTFSPRGEDPVRRGT